MSQITAQVVQAFQSGQPVKIHAMSWKTFIEVFNELGRYRMEQKR